MKKRIAITGVSGFVGSSLVVYLSSLNHTIIGISRTEPKPEIKSLLANWYQADLGINCPSVNCDIVIHCAGLASETGDISKHLLNNTYATTVTFNSIKCEQFIYISSASVYENIRGELKEDREIGDNCRSAYAISKHRAEQFLLKQMNGGRKIVILRPRAIYGKNDSVLLPKLLKLSITNKIQVVLGNADFYTSLTHILKLSGIIELIIEGEKEGIYNVCDDEPYLLSDVLKEIHRYKTGTRPFQISLNTGLLYFWLKLTEKLKIKSTLTPQSLQYLTRPCVLNTDKLRTEFSSGLGPVFSTAELG